MGCCVSTPRKDHHAIAAQTPKPSETPPPMHAAEELETVKQVLSETPKWNPITTPKPEPQNNALHKFKEEEKKTLLFNKAQEEEEEASEVSEVCGFMSETMSISTTTTDQRGEEAEQTRKRVIRSPTKMHKNRSFSGDVGGKRERKVHHASRNGGVGSTRLAQCRDQAGQRMVSRGTRNQPLRRDSGETSFRRSRSPATSVGDGAARSVVGRCPSARRTNGSPAAAAGDAPPENGRRKMENPVRESKWACASNETLENPLVSLECFIFI